MKKKRHLVFWILFPIVFILIAGIMLFYLDLANGALVCLILEIILLVIFLISRILFINAKIYKRLILWALFILCNAGIVLMAHPKVGLKQAAYYNNPVKTEVLDTNYGKVQGVLNEDESVRIYAGIPYAKPPVGELRWKEPQNPDSWSDIRDCSYFRARSYQPDKSEVMMSLVDIYAQGRWVPDFSEKLNEEMSEDSLYLNIWRPNTTETNLPVLVYIHGGSLTTGTPSFEDYNGEEMAKTGVIMITIAYRLGIFGYFAHNDLKAESPNNTTGNYGLLDQIKALEWVNNNIASFGGDKNNITIAGESAGSSSVSALCVSPLAKGLFKRAIGESSSLIVKTPPHTYRSFNTAIDMGKKIMNEFNCATISDLRKVDASKLVNTKYLNQEMTLDGYAINKNPYDVYLEGNNNEEELLNGYNVKEADAFSVTKYLFSPTNKNNIRERLLEVFDTNTTDKLMNLYKDEIEKDAFTTFNDIFSIFWFMYPHQSWSRVAKSAGVKVYRYHFTKNNNYYGTYHSGELIYAYGNVKRTPYKYRYNQSDISLSEVMLKYWSNFAKYGNPNSSNLTKWDEWNNLDNKVMEFGDNVGMINDRYLRAYEIFDSYYNL